MVKEKDIADITLKKGIFLAITDKGLGEIAAIEISEILGTEASIISKSDSAVKFNTNFVNACKLCYNAQSIKKCLMLIAEAQISADLEQSLASFLKLIEKESIIFLESSSFRVDCERLGTHDFSSVDFAKGIADIMLEQIHAKIDFKNPKYIIFSYIADADCYIGLDLSGFDLSKREYRIFNHPSAIKGTIAYALFRTAFNKSLEKKGDSYKILNFFCKSGVVAIEAALFMSSFPVNFFRKTAFSFINFDFVKMDFENMFSEIDSEAKKSEMKFKIFASDPHMRNLSAAKKNAKIAGVEKKIEFSRNDLEWLDIKFGKQDIDIIISDLSLSKNEDAKKILKEFFYQCNYLLKKHGTIALLCREESLLLLIKESAAVQNFNIIEQRQFWQGQQPLTSFLIVRK